MTYHKNITIEVPAEVEFILKTIRDAGFEAYIVGGCVRDQLLGRVPDDWDITTSALPEQVKSLFRHTVDTGIQHGTVMVLKNGKGFEVTTYRIDGEYRDGRHPESVEFTASLEEDLKRRDFTVNAFAYNPEEGIVDLFGGIDDLNNGVIRAVGVASERFNEDALRIMRAVRFSAQLSFTIEEKTKAAISDYALRLADISRERIRVEFEKTLFSQNPAYVNIYERLGLAQFVIPDVSEKCFGDDEVYSSLTDGRDNATGIVSDKSGCDKILRLAVFFRNLSYEEIQSVMRKMTFDNKTRDLVSKVVDSKCYPTPQNRMETRQALRLLGKEVFSEVLKLKQVLTGEDVTEAAIMLVEVIVSKEAYSLSMLAVNGNDLINAGIKPGVQIKEILEMLLDKVIEQPELNEKELLLEMVG